MMGIKLLLVLGLAFLLVGGIVVLNVQEDRPEEKITITKTYPKVCSVNVIDYSNGESDTIFGGCN